MPVCPEWYESAAGGKIYGHSRSGGNTKKNGGLTVADNPAENLDELDASNQGMSDYFMDIDRMVNEGLGGGTVTVHNGLIEATTTDTMDHPESVLNPEGRRERGMNIDRAQEILQADNRVDVELNGVAVWIDSVDSSKETAKVHVEDNPADVKIVMVDELEEVQ